MSQAVRLLGLVRIVLRESEEPGGGEGEICGEWESFRGKELKCLFVNRCIKLAVGCVGQLDLRRVFT